MSRRTSVRPRRRSTPITTLGPDSPRRLARARAGSPPRMRLDAGSGERDKHTDNLTTARRAPNQAAWRSAMSGAPASPYSADALAANQAGQLTDQQRQAFRGRDRAFRKSELIGAAGAAIIGVLLITSSGPSPEAWLRPYASVALFVIAAGLLVRATLAGDSLSTDLASGSVQTVEGAVLKD